MTPQTRRAFLRGVAAVGITGGLGACVAYTEGPLPYAYYPDYYYDYYYYPDVDAYFHIYSGDYYYRSGKRWVRSRNLPHNVWLDKRRRVPLHIKSGRPYKGDRDRRSRYVKRQDWSRSKFRTERYRVGADRRERRHNLDSHMKYHRKYQY
jgi:hypothetical protein